MRIRGILVGIAILVFGYFWVVLNWNYSSGERAGWVQKLSKKGWLCKTWEGEMAMVSMPGAAPEKFYFTVWDDAVAGELTRSWASASRFVMTKRSACRPLALEKRVIS
ncbi:MAG TPA: hypothetical protein VEG60_12165 [Candidatus Binatia bacterium]|nr:hypothetical protein [Candidatus Binatia bacterium]